MHGRLLLNVMLPAQSDRLKRQRTDDAVVLRLELDRWHSADSSVLTRVHGDKPVKTVKARDTRQWTDD